MEVVLSTSVLPWTCALSVALNSPQSYRFLFLFFERDGTYGTQGFADFLQWEKSFQFKHFSKFYPICLAIPLDIIISFQNPDAADVEGKKIAVLESI